MGGTGRQSLNYAYIVYRLVTNPRGYSKRQICDDLEVQDRAYRKYRKILQEEFRPLITSDGESLIQEVEEGGERFLRLNQPTEVWHSSSDFISQVATLHFAKQILAFAQHTPIGEAVETVLADFDARLRDKSYVVGTVLKDVDRMFFDIADAPKSYEGKEGLIRMLLHALFTNRRIDVSYDSASKPTAKDLVLEPMSLATWRSGLYLIAAVKDYPQPNIRMFAIKRILKCEVLEERFVYPSRTVYDPETYMSGAWGIYRGPEGNEIDFELVFADERWLKKYLLERQWHLTQSFSDMDDGRLKMTFTVSSDREVWRWIRGFGEDVEVITPEPPEAS